MKKSAYIIGFSILSGIFIVAYIAFYKYAGLDSNNDNIRTQKDDYNNNPVLSSESDTQYVNTNNEPVISNTTLLITEYNNTVTGEEKTQEGVFTPEYFGMNRAGYLKTLDENSTLLSFSDDRVAIRVNLEEETTKIEYSYFILLENNKISVYKSDKKTLYFSSTISLNQLSNEEIAELTEGKLIKDVDELYNFLESHTS